MYDRDGSSTRCVNQCFKPCEKYNNFCSGKNSANYVYKISKTITVQKIVFLSFYSFLSFLFSLFSFFFLQNFHSFFVHNFVLSFYLFCFLISLISPTEDGSCEVEIKPVGCYKEVEGHLAMGDIFHNEGAPDQPNYDGKMLPFSKEYKTHFPEFLCRCARVAKQNGWEYFGVRDMG